MRLFALLFFLFYKTALLFSADAVVFAYHRFNDERHKSTNISNEKLKTDFTYLKENNYTVVPLSKIVDMIKKNIPIPEKTIALTIDDNYKSFYENGLPIFKEFGYPFTLYVYVEGTEKKYGDFMRWHEIIEASKYGELGLHSYSHPRLTHLSDNEVLNDTAKAKTIFEKRMGFSPKSYSYPYGESDERTQKIIKSFGFDFICNQNNGAVTNTSDTNDIDRIAVSDDTDIKQKLHIKALDIKKLDIKRDKNKLEKIDLLLNDKNIEYIEMYISGYEWVKLKVNDGKVSYNIDKILKLDRNTVTIRDGNKIATKLVIKEK